jgi:MazG family protein
MEAPRYTLDDLLRIMARLRGEDGCAWDREQTHASIRANLFEEANEVAGAIDAGDTANLAEELGDLLLQVVFHAQIASESGTFTFRDVVQGICEKLIERHPHVFGDAKAGTAEEALASWNAVKRRSPNKG